MAKNNHPSSENQTSFIVLNAPRHKTQMKICFVNFANLDITPLQALYTSFAFQHFVFISFIAQNLTLSMHIVQLWTYIYILYIKM